jgi:hypothetical protein
MQVLGNFINNREYIAVIVIFGKVLTSLCYSQKHLQHRHCVEIIFVMVCVMCSCHVTQEMLSHLYV